MPDTANNNVISLDKYDSARREFGNGPAINALEAIRELCRQRLIRNMKYMMTRCDDALYGCAQMAESSIVQDLYLDSIDELKAISGDVEKHFIDRFIEQFNLGVPRGMLQLGVSEPGTELDDSDSAYHRNDRVSEDLAIYKMIEKTRDQCAQILQSLDRRIGFLMRDPSLERCQNPLSPESICEAFRAAVTETVSQVKYGFEIRPILFNLFDQYVLGYMDVVYKELDIHLIKLGIQPQLNTNAQNPDSNTDMPGYQDFPLSNNAMPHSEPGACFVPEQIIIQAADSRFSGNATENDEQLGVDEPLLNQDAGKTGGITIDVVVMMFERILEDKNIADPMRALLGRLQIPLIKVAIQDPRFFSDKNHPARLLLNRLADSALGWDEHLGHEDPLYRKIDTIVQAILNGFYEETDLFTSLLEDLENFLGSREAQASINVRRSIKVLEGEERLVDARSKAMEEIEECIHSGVCLDFIHGFLTTHWKDLLFLIHARQGKESDEWKQALSTMDDLVWSIKPMNSKDECQRLMSMQPALFNSLREGMQRLSVPVTEQDTFLAKLMHAHASASAENIPAEQRMESGCEGENGETADAGVVADKPGRARPGNFNTQNYHLRDYKAGVDDIFTAQARQIQPGAWIELLGSDGKAGRAKLSWVSPITRTYLFTDQMGRNAGNYSIEELAQLMRSGRARSLRVSTK